MTFEYELSTDKWLPFNQAFRVKFLGFIEEFTIRNSDRMYPLQYVGGVYRAWLFVVVSAKYEQSSKSTKLYSGTYWLFNGDLYSIPSVCCDCFLR